MCQTLLQAGRYGCVTLRCSSSFYGAYILLEEGRSLKRKEKEKVDGATSY